MWSPPRMSLMMTDKNVKTMPDGARSDSKARGNWERFACIPTAPSGRLRNSMKANHRRHRCRRCSNWNQVCTAADRRQWVERPSAQGPDVLAAAWLTRGRCSSVDARLMLASWMQVRGEPLEPAAQACSVSLLYRCVGAS